MRLRSSKSPRKPKRGKRNLFGLYLVEGASSGWRSIIVRDQLTLESFARVVRILFPVIAEADLRFEPKNDRTPLELRRKLGELLLEVGDEFHCTDREQQVRVQVRLETLRIQEDDEPRLAYCVGSSGEGGLTAATLNELFGVNAYC